MMSQENYVNINDLHQQGWTILEIAEATGWHRTTVSNYLKNGPPPATRATEATVMTEHWQQRISTMLESWPRLQSASIHNKLAATGFKGSYPTVVRRCATFVALGSGRLTRCRCRSTPTRARKRSTSATCRRGRRASVGASPASRRSMVFRRRVADRGAADPGSPFRAACADGRFTRRDHLVSGGDAKAASIPLSLRGRIRRIPRSHDLTATWSGHEPRVRTPARNADWMRSA